MACRPTPKPQKKNAPADVAASREPVSSAEPSTFGKINSELENVKRCDLPRATHGSTVRFGEIEVDGYVLENGVACLSKRGVLRLLTGKDASQLEQYVRALRKSLGKVPVTNSTASGILPQKNSGEVPVTNIKFVSFKTADGSAVVDGLDADSVVDLFQLYVKALEKGVLRADQIQLAARAAIVLGAVAREGLKLAIYSATGAKQYLEAQLVEDRIAASLRKEAGKWEQLFTPEFFIELARLLRVQASRNGKRPTVFAWFLATYFYKWWDLDTYKRLKERNPHPTKGKRHHQFLTDFARDRFKQHQRDVLILMKSSSTISDFANRFGAAFKNRGLQLSLGGGAP